jgi:hypothetical protein
LVEQRAFNPTVCGIVPHPTHKKNMLENKITAQMYLEKAAAAEMSDDVPAYPSLKAPSNIWQLRILYWTGAKFTWSNPR